MNAYLRACLIAIAIAGLSGCSQQAVPGAFPINASTSVRARVGLLEKLTAENIQVIQRGDKLTIILLTDRCFAQGSNTIDESCYPALDNIAALLKTYTARPIIVAGYTDEVQNSCYNGEWSRHLADSIVAYLWSHGIPWQCMRAVGYGDTQPIASTHTVCGNAVNRRIEITICGGALNH
jgi:outer membrane protein OmpA-like peptidoglycan-associated protein